MSTALTLSGQNSARLIERSWGSPEQRHGSSDDETSKIGPQTASPVQENRWPSISPLTEGNHSAPLTPLPYLRDWSSTAIEKYGTPLRDEDYSTYDPEPLTNKAPWSTPSPVLYGKKNRGAPEPPHRFPHGYAPQLLPDEPPNYRRQGTYRGKGKSRLLAGADGDEEMGGGGAGAQPGGLSGPADPTDEERLEQAHALYDHERQRADHLEQEIEALRLGQRLGRDPLRRRGPPTHWFSIPQPDDYEGPPPVGPSGTYNRDHPPAMSDVKPLLMEKPQYFEGAHDDIERFLGDCKTYFETFR